MKTTKKAIAIVLSVMLLLSVMPMAFAATTGVANGAELKTAIAAAQNGDVIEFTEDNTTYPATSGALVIPVDGKSITIDLKGHTQYFRVSGETAVSYPTDLFVLKNGATLTIVDSEGGGAIYATYGAKSAAYIFNVLDTSNLVINGGQFVMDAANYGGVIVYQNSADASTVINGGEFTANTGATARRDYLINNTRGDVEINGGTFTTARDFDYVISEGNTTDTSLTINDGAFNGTMSLDTTKATTELNGGTYKTVAGNANTAVSAYLPADQIVDSTTGEIKNVDPSTVARTNSAEFTTLAAAIASIADGATDTITLLADCTLDGTTEITGNQKITIDMNGYDITCPARVFNIRHGQLTLKGTGALNATVVGTTAAVAVYGAATDQGSNYSVFTLNSTVTINALGCYGAMIGATKDTTTNKYGSYGAKLQLNGTINSAYGVAINGNIAEPEVKTNAAALNITGTVISDNEDAAVYAAGFAKVNVYSSANITGGSGLYIKSGIINVYGNATITATGAKAPYKFNGSGSDSTGDAIVIDSCGYPGNVPTVSVKAGTITSANGAAVASYAKQDDPRYPTAEYPVVDNVIPATSTAVFSSNVSDLAAEGYKTSYDETKGGYVVAKAIDGSNLVLEGSIEQAIYVDALSYTLDDDAVIKVNANASADASETPNFVTTTYAVKSLKPYVDPDDTYTGTFKFVFKNAPAQVTEDVTIELFKSASDTEPLKTITYSVKDYCDKVIAESNDAKLVALCKSILDYAAAAQIRFNYNTEEMAEDGFYNADAIEALTANDIEGAVFDSEAPLSSASFACFSTTDINLYVKDHAVNSTGASIEADPDSAVKATTKTRGLSKYINISGIEAGNMLNTVTVETEVGTIHVNSQFIAQLLIAYSNNANDVTLAKTVYFYANAADAYFN